MGRGVRMQGTEGNPGVATFRRVVGKFATGVTVVTTRTEAGLHGLTANAFCSVSLDPLLVLVCVDRLSQGHERIEEAGAFAISVLSERQEFLAERFAGRAPMVDPDFSEAPYEVAVSGAPILRGCVSWLDCRLWATYDGGDHSIFVGQVVAVGDNPGEPLLFYASRYARLRTT